MVRCRNVERRRNPFEYSGFFAARVRNLLQLRSQNGEVGSWPKTSTGDVRSHVSDWVTSGQCADIAHPSLLDPKRHFATANCRIAKGSFNHVVGDGKHVGSHLDAERLAPCAS